MLELADHGVQHDQHPLKDLAHPPLGVGAGGVGLQLVAQALDEQQQLGREVVRAPGGALGDVDHGRAHGVEELGPARGSRTRRRRHGGALGSRRFVWLELLGDLAGELAGAVAQLVGGGGRLEEGGAHERSV